ncbi:MAG TPA: ABC transporter permease, partial [Gemmatimonadaceae bacterium]
MRELEYAVRRLRNSPTFTAAVLLVLAILIGATASVFALVDGVVFKPFDVNDPSRLLVVWESSSARHMPQFAVAAANYLDWEKQNTTFTDLAAVAYEHYTLRTREGSPERVIGAAVTPNYFRMLGLRPIVGRIPSSDSDATEILISDGYWRRSFGGSPAVIGQVVDLDDNPKTIVGVVPPGASLIYDVYNTLQFTPAERADRDRHYLAVIGRVRAGVTPTAAQQNLATIAARLSTAFPTTNRDWSVQVVPLLDQIVGKVRPALVLLLVAGLCVLLVGAANLTNLFLVRGDARSYDLAVKSALGATRARLVTELAAESVILALLGGALGFALSLTGVRVVKLLAPANLPRLDSVSVDAGTVLFCLAAAGTMILLFGLVPAHRLSAADASTLVREGARTGRSRRRVRLQDTLVVAQVFVSVLLLTTALLFLQAFDHFRRLDEGFRPDGVLTAEISVPRSRYATPEQQ